MTNYNAAPGITPGAVLHLQSGNAHGGDKVFIAFAYVLLSKKYFRAIIFIRKIFADAIKWLPCGLL